MFWIRLSEIDTIIIIYVQEVFRVYLNKFEIAIAYSFLIMFLVSFLERADLFTLLYLMFSCVFITFLYGVLGHVWYLIVFFLAW